MNLQFKKGDKVYCPKVGTAIYTLQDSIDVRYPLLLVSEYGDYSFTREGFEYNSDSLRSLFHVTDDNRELLGKLYGTVFDLDVKPKLPREVIQEMLDDGWYSVPVRYSEDNEGVMGYAFKTYVAMNARPFDPKTGKAIIDYIDGNVVTE